MLRIFLHALSLYLAAILVWPCTAMGSHKHNVVAPNVSTTVHHWAYTVHPGGQDAFLDVMAKTADDSSAVYVGTYTDATGASAPVAGWYTPMWYASPPMVSGYICPITTQPCAFFEAESHAQESSTDGRVPYIVTETLRNDTAKTPFPPKPAWSPQTPPPYPGLARLHGQPAWTINTLPGLTAQLANVLPPPHFLLLQDLQAQCSMTSLGSIVCGGYFERQHILYGAVVVAPTGKIDVFFYGSRNNGRIRNLAWHYSTDRNRPESLPPDMEELIQAWDFDGWPPLDTSATRWLHVNAVSPSLPAVSVKAQVNPGIQVFPPSPPMFTARWTLSGDVKSGEVRFDVVARQTPDGTASFSGSYTDSTGENVPVTGSILKDWDSEVDLVDIYACPSTESVCTPWRTEITNDLAPPQTQNFSGPQYPSHVYMSSTPEKAQWTSPPVRPLPDLERLDGRWVNAIFAVPGVVEQLADILPPPHLALMQRLDAECTMLESGSLSCGGSFAQHEQMPYAAVLLRPTGSIHVFFHNPSPDGPVASWHYTNDRQHPDSLPPDMDEVLAAWDFSPYARPASMTGWWHASVPGNHE